jgi:hypothetical protein
MSKWEPVFCPVRKSGFHFDFGIVLAKGAPKVTPGAAAWCIAGQFACTYSCQVSV